MIAHHAGKFLDEGEPAVPLGNGGFLHGCGVFTTLRIQAGRPRWLDKHRQRLADHARKLDLPAPYPLHELPEVISELLEINRLQNKNLRLRLTLTEEEDAAVLTAQLAPLPVRLEHWHSHGLAAVSLGPEFQRTFLPEMKTTSYLPSVLALREATGRRCDEALVFDAADRLLEGAMSNIFLVRDGTLLTPAADGRILDGLTRQFILELAAEQGLPAREEAIHRREVGQAEEIFLTNCVRGVVPISTLDGRPVGQARPGPVTCGLLRGWLGSP